MNPREKDAWSKLAAAARRAPAEPDISAPFGFAPRVAALAAESRRPSGSWLERLSWRAMIVACALAVAAVGMHFYSPRPEAQDLAAASSDDPVAQVVDSAS